MRASYPAMCLSECSSGQSRGELVDNYKAKGFGMFDDADQWALMRKGVYEAYIRRSSKTLLTWVATVVQLQPGIEDAA